MRFRRSCLSTTHGRLTHILDPKIVIPLRRDRSSHLAQPVDGRVALFQYAAMTDRLRVSPPGTTTIIERAAM
jgi:hypothetical protein